MKKKQKSYFYYTILHLVLKGCWYDKIERGEKTSEYREMKPYWNKKFRESETHLGRTSVALYQSVIFHRGYTSQTMHFRIKEIRASYNEPNDLGLQKCWEIKLGERIT